MHCPFFKFVRGALHSLKSVGFNCFAIATISSSVGLKYNLNADCINLTISSSDSIFKDCVAYHADHPNFRPSVKIIPLGEESECERFCASSRTTVNGLSLLPYFLV